MDRGAEEKPHAYHQGTLTQTIMEFEGANCMH